VLIVTIAKLDLGGWSIPDPKDIPRGTPFGHPDDETSKPAKPKKPKK